MFSVVVVLPDSSTVTVVVVVVVLPDSSTTISVSVDDDIPLLYVTATFFSARVSLYSAPRIIFELSAPERMFISPVVCEISAYCEPLTIVHVAADVTSLNKS